MLAVRTVRRALDISADTEVALAGRTAHQIVREERCAEFVLVVVFDIIDAHREGVRVFILYCSVPVVQAILHVLQRISGVTGEQLILPGESDYFHDALLAGAPRLAAIANLAG